MKRISVLFIIGICCVFSVFAKKKPVIAEPYAWRNTQPLGNRYRVPMDTLQLNFYQTDQPSSYSTAYGYTGNLGGPGFSKIFFDRPQMPQFIFKAPFHPWITTPENFDFYNTRIPMTLLSYLTGGSKVKKQDDLKAVFSGNVNAKLGFGANIQYLYSRGSYDHQATNELSWQLSSNYIGEKYQLQVMFNTYNFVCQENGGLADDNYILHPTEMDGGTGIDSQSIPINLSDAYNRVRGQNYYATQRYNVGFYKTETKDTTTIETFVPVTSFIHTIEYNRNFRRFVNLSADEDQKFFKNTYFNKNGSNDTTSYWSLKNTLGISLLEGFNKYAKMGLAAYMTYEIRQFKLMPDTVPSAFAFAPETPVLGEPVTFIRRSSSRYYTENLLWIGAEVSKRQGKILTYTVNGKLGLTGPEVGSFDVNGEIQTRFPIFKDTVQLRAYGFFKNLEPAFYYKHYVSNHFIWNNNFNKIRNFRVGGEFAIERWGTRLNVGVENVQNYVYFDENCMPRQESSIMQVFSAKLNQSFKVGILNLDIEAVYQKSSRPSIISLPDLSAYGNLYLSFPIAKVLNTQIGVDCRYHTEYYAEGYQPATLSFYNQREFKIGNYPMMNVYANMKLKMVRFYVLYSNFNQGMFGGNNYFSMLHYPINPATLQFGVSVDFAN